MTTVDIIVELYIVVRAIVVFEMGSQHQMISDSNTITDGLMFRGTHCSFLEATCLLEVI